MVCIPWEVGTRNIYTYQKESRDYGNKNEETCQEVGAAGEKACFGYGEEDESGAA
jgi:hypothetical protein